MQLSSLLKHVIIARALSFALCAWSQASPGVRTDWTVPAPTQPSGVEGDQMNTFHATFFGGGTNRGPLNGFGQGWRGSQQFFLSTVFNARGISQGTSWNSYDNKAGDHMGLGYGYFAYQAGCGMALSDEGCGVLTTQFLDFKGFTGTIEAGGAGNTKPSLHQTGGSGTVDQSDLLDISKGTIAGRLNGYGSSPSGLPTLKVTGVTLPLTTAWGTSTAPVPDTGLTPDHQSTTPVHIAVTLGPIAGRIRSFTPGWAIIAGPEFAEQIEITAVSEVSSGVQTLSFSHHHPHSAGAKILQGGLSSGEQFLSADEVYELTSSSPAYQGEGGPRRTAFHVYGSLTGSDLLYGVDGYTSALNGVSLGDGRSGISGKGGFHLYPGAEIVANLSAGSSPQLEPNPWPWTPGDTIEDPHPSANHVNEMWLISHLTSPTTEESHKLYLTYDGAGISDWYRPLHFNNGNPCRMYQGCNGTLHGPVAITIDGAHAGAITFRSVLAGGDFAEVESEIGGTGYDPFDLIRLFSNTGKGPLPGALRLSYNPKSALLSWNGDFAAPNWTGPQFNRFGTVRWGYNSGGGPYLQLSNTPNGGYGVGDTWASLDGAKAGDHLGNLQLHSIKPDNGWTGTCPSGHSLIVKNGIVTGCQ